MAWHVTLQLNDYFNHESAIEVNNERLGEDSPSGKILNPYSYVLYAAGDSNNNNNNNNLSGQLTLPFNYFLSFLIIGSDLVF